MHIIEPGEYKDHNGDSPIILGESYPSFKEQRENGINIQNWIVRNVVTVEDTATAVITDSDINELTVYGLCFLKKTKVHHIRVGMFGNLCFLEDNDVWLLDINGTVHSLNNSKVHRINLHRGGRLRINTKDHYAGQPKQPDNIYLDEDRDFCWKIWKISHAANEASTMEYWTFG